MMKQETSFSGDMDESLEAFATSLAVRLRKDVYAGDGFAARTMAAIRREGHDHLASGAQRGGIASLLRPRTVRIAPLTMALFAATALVAVALGSATLARRGSPLTPMVAPSPVAVAPAAETVQIVRFQLAAPGAQSVALVGDFNDWSRDAIKLQPAGMPGVWTASVALKQGRHEYAFIVDGKRWVADPYAETRSDEFNVKSSVVRVDASGT